MRARTTEGRQSFPVQRVKAEPTPRAPAVRPARYAWRGRRVKGYQYAARRNVSRRFASFRSKVATASYRFAEATATIAASARPVRVSGQISSTRFHEQSSTIRMPGKVTTARTAVVSRCPVTPVLALQHVSDFEDDGLRDDARNFAVFGGGEKRSRCGVLCLVSLDKERDEDVRIDDDATHLRCVLWSSELERSPSVHRGRA